MKIDFRRTLPSYSARRGSFQQVVVPPLQFLMIDGSGDPNTSPEYAAALQALYPVAYRLKFTSKNDLDRDYAVMPLEAQWWSDDMDSFTTARDKSQWRWTLLSMVPDWITREQFDAAILAVEKRAGRPRPSAPPTGEHPAEPLGTAALRLERVDDGLCVQTLHVGPYDDEAPVLAAMHADYIPAHSLRLTGRHHEIYLSDPRRTAPEKLRTILRQPVAIDDGGDVSGGGGGSSSD